MPTQTLGKRRLSSGSPPPQSSSSASSSRGPRTNSAALKPSQEELGLSALVVCNADQEAKLNYVSESMQDILGYTSSDLIGKSVYLIFHPDEVPFLRQIHYQALTEERTACVAYFRVLHRDGYYVECCCSYYTVYNMSLALYTRAVDGYRTLQQALTAREVIEISPASQGRFSVKRWSSSAPQTSTPLSITTIDNNHPWPKPPKPTPRTFYIMDRFTDTSRVIYVSNDVIINGSSLLKQSFYSIIRPSDRPRVRKYIEAAKKSTPIMFDEQRSGGHGYTTFHVLKIPDLPPAGEIWPQGNDESERSMPGQEFILVEGIFTANSDGLTCIISKISEESKVSEPPKALENNTNSKASAMAIENLTG
ncbi:hypothetical protein C349_06519 [Cryptococcus neoformans var. grubii Br795]|nr:hypothetical protein C355_06438 [Cryptococcus neoformans var. grubii Th84]OXG73346.1 hypothetical protein C349_06519 [Cryptococcus neoformans var. grubii Br795]OXG77252.1 hypothetical protein C346_06414 [Cryptococcus neoformans var. grubii D17-1]OXG92494.1 hypothetical protein C345_06020 [Cryptococcus neoformans var. grubii A2-102-5]OXH09151.1 hypothetical protein J010_03749 [Cryptococcus neoformans var. grubii]